MTGKFYQLKDGEQEGLYPGLGVIQAGKTYEVYGEAQHDLVKADARFKFVSGVTAPGTVDEADTARTKSARGGKGSE